MRVQSGADEAVVRVSLFRELTWDVSFPGGPALEIVPAYFLDLATGEESWVV